MDMDSFETIDYSDPPPMRPFLGRRVYSVSQINHDVRMSLESKFSTIWIEGEISNLKKHTSGHIYLSLKDDKAQVSACFFSRYNAGLKFELKDGQQVLVLGKLSLYEARGQFQLYIERVEPKGVGALQLAFVQLKEKLEKEGLFNPARKRSIPPFPKCVGIITSPTGAAIRDILNVMNRRSSGTHVLLNPVQVQGAGAAAQIARAIEEMNRVGGLDVLIVGRGGGSLEDLWAFNEEVVARAIFNSKIPIISAVGHEIDWTIADFVADLRAPTPSAAAELVVQNRADLEKRLREFQYRLANTMSGLIEDKRRALEDLEQSYAFKQPAVLIQQYEQRLDELLRQMQNYLKSCVNQQTHLFRSLAGKLNTLSPLGILERGYSISFKETGGLLKDGAVLKKGDIIKTQLWRGKIESQVTRVELEGESS